jgi:hypothetical protein
MKKILLTALLCVVFYSSNFAQDQLTGPQIYSIISKSKEANVANGVLDPNKIMPGQTLTFLFEDGKTETIVAEAGDSQWKIVGGKLAELVKQHGQPVQFNQPIADVVKPVEVLPGKIEDIAPWYNSDYVLIFLAALLIVSILLLSSYLLKRRNSRKTEAAQDPVTSGEPMRRGGITNENALAYTRQVAERQFNNPNIIVSEVRHGRLSGENLEVYYAGQIQPSRRTFQNYPAYRGTVQAEGEGTNQFVYFLQGCGNDVRAGNYFSGQNIQFIEDVDAEVITPVQQTVAAPAIETVKAVPLNQNEAMKELFFSIATQKQGKMVMVIEDGRCEITAEFTNPEPVALLNGAAKNSDTVANVATIQQQ